MIPAVVGCGKRPYPTRRAARAAITRLTRQGRDETRHYHCAYCIAWHLTSRKHHRR